MNFKLTSNSINIDDKLLFSNFIQFNGLEQMLAMANDNSSKITYWNGIPTDILYNLFIIGYDFLYKSSDEILVIDLKNKTIKTDSLKINDLKDELSKNRYQIKRIDDIVVDLVANNDKFRICKYRINAFVDFKDRYYFRAPYSVPFSNFTNSRIYDRIKMGKNTSKYSIYWNGIAEKYYDDLYKFGYSISLIEYFENYYNLRIVNSTYDKIYDLRIYGKNIQGAINHFYLSNNSLSENLDLTSLNKSFKRMDKAYKEFSNNMKKVLNQISKKKG